MSEEIMRQLDRAKEQFKRYGHMTTNDVFDKMDADAAEIARLVGLVEDARAQAIEECAKSVEETALRNPDNIARDLRRLKHPSTVRECKCQPLTRYTDSPHDPECPLSDAPQERQPE